MSTYDPDYTPKSEIRTKERKLYIVFLVVVAICLIGAFLSSKGGWRLIQVNDLLAENWNDIFLKYFFIIIAVERAAAVFVGVSRNQNKRKWEKRIKRVREVLDMDKSSLSVPELYTVYQREAKIITSFEEQKKNGDFLGIAEPTLTTQTGKKTLANTQENINELKAYLQATKNVYEFKAAVYEENTSAQLTRFVFLGGIVISAVGLSIFNDIFDATALETNKEGFLSQYFFYRLNDIVVTGGLLGGGSKSFNVFVETLNKTFERVKDPKGTD